MPSGTVSGFDPEQFAGGGGDGLHQPRRAGPVGLGPQGADDGVERVGPGGRQAAEGGGTGGHTRDATAAPSTAPIRPPWAAAAGRPPAVDRGTMYR